MENEILISIVSAFSLLNTYSVIYYMVSKKKIMINILLDNLSLLNLWLIMYCVYLFLEMDANWIKSELLAYWVVIFFFFLIVIMPFILSYLERMKNSAQNSFSIKTYFYYILMPVFIFTISSFLLSLV